MSLKVIGANFGRTATMSLKQGLEILGFEKCYHMSEVVVHPEHVKLWLEAWQGKNIWATLFADYQAAVDWPAAAFWPQLMHVYPEAKIVLSIRDADEWFESARKTIFQSMDSNLLAKNEEFRARVEILKNQSQQDLQKLNLLHRIEMLKEIIVDGTFDGDLWDKDKCIKIYKDNIEKCRSEVPLDRLIEFDPSLGWEPLCRGLDRTIPQKPYPHVNKAEEFLHRWRNQKDPSK